MLLHYFKTMEVQAMDYKFLANQCMLRLKEITAVEMPLEPFNTKGPIILQFDEKLIVRFLFDENKGRLYWYIYIGSLPDDTAESNDICKVLLVANGLAQTLIDCTFTLEPDEFGKSLITLVGGVTLSLEDADTFIAKLELFLQVAEHWKEAFSEEASTTLDARTVKTVSDTIEESFVKV